MTVNRRLLGLVVGHVVLGIILALSVFIELPGSFLDDILWVLLCGLAYCQILLLVVWGVTSTGSPWGRMAGLIVGAVYLEALFAPRELIGMSTVTVTITTAALLVVRALGVRLIRFDDPAQSAPCETEGFRFSIRGLMLVTAAVALLSVEARALGEAPINWVLSSVGWAMYFVAVGLVAIWAALGVGRPLRRGPVVFGLSLVRGAFLAFAVGVVWILNVYTFLTMLVYSTLLFGSLLVVRSCGYRFVGRAVASSKPPHEQTGSLPLQIPASGVTAPE